MKHKTNCAAYSNYQPPYYDCTCGAEEMTFKYDEILCPKCKGPMISRKGKFGIFWGCKSFPNCDGTRDSEGKSKFEREQEKKKNIHNKEYDGSDLIEMEDEEKGKPTFRFNRDR